MRNFRDLKIWKRSFKLANNIYEQSKGMPNDEKFGLTSQIRRSAVSIPSNIAEGVVDEQIKILKGFWKLP